MSINAFESFCLAQFSTVVLGLVSPDLSAARVSLPQLLL